jgi:hypothetical protein
MPKDEGAGGGAQGRGLDVVLFIGHEYRRRTYPIDD